MPGHRKRRQFKQTDAFTRGMVIGLKRAGWSIRQIAADTHLGASTVHRLWRRWLEQGNVAIYRNAGATRVTSARVDRRILRQAVAAPQATCTAILQHVQDTLDHSISTRTISRRLVANGLHSCRPLRRLPLTPPNRRRRLEWCRARSTWMTEWHRVVFSDESRFCLSSDSRRVRVWRRRGERSNPAAIVERPTVRQRGIMVWGAIAYDSRSPLLRIQGTMTAQRYVDDVLRPVTLPYLQGVPNALYQQDNARPHTARISQQALQDVQMPPLPPCSPDLSPIEHVWDIIGRRLHALPQPRSEDELWQMVEREWRAIPQDAIRTLIDSPPRRVAACIAVRGKPPLGWNLRYIREYQIPIHSLTYILLVSNMQNPEKINILQCRRLSKRARAPLLVSIPDHNERIKLFKNAFKLRNFKIYTSKDYTLGIGEQRRILIAKRKELLTSGTFAKLRDNKLIVAGIKSIADQNGNFTYISDRGSSVLDYFVVTPLLLDLIENFQVECSPYPDHLPITLSALIVPGSDRRITSLQSMVNYSRHTNPTPLTSYRWTHENSQFFSQALNEIHLNWNHSIDSTMRLLTDKIIDTMGKAGMQRRSKTSNPNSKPWFD
ncbi:hypothetical protein LAZ67_3004473 [Cordylochernes scorpioides]|uniref:Transposase n=1 Tax=Cordylochernes scorpioides TaxID=51811 RepID=A0ABY6KAG6_9ARAC|nr:hypothetical protein LAZ67_3004473 [Cordylochernes scorpioides]